MNIFATDSCPVQSALWLDDKRVVKMASESAQMLSTCVRMYSIEPVDDLWKASYHNHPCTVWARQSRQNFDWLVTHGLALCVIYTQVYKRTHAAERIIRRASKHRHVFADLGLTPFANCTEFKGTEHADESIHTLYKWFMRLKWMERDARIPTWRNRNSPEWRYK